MTLRALILALTATLATAAPAAAFLAQNDLVVLPQGSDRFAIPYRGKSGTPDFWCAAGDYVIRGLGLPASTRIYRLSPGPRRSGEGIDFSLASLGAQPSGLAIVGSPDAGISASAAHQLCELRQLRERLSD